MWQCLRSRGRLLNRIGRNSFSRSINDLTRADSFPVELFETSPTPLSSTICGQCTCRPAYKSSRLSGLGLAAAQDGQSSTNDQRGACFFLQDFLSCTVVGTLMTPQDVVALYERVRFCIELRRVDLSSLISFFGTLSVPMEDRPRCSPHANNLVSLLPQEYGDSHQAYWRVLFLLIEDKQRLQQPLTLADHFWAMQAELVSAKSPTYREASRSDRCHITRATGHYLTLCRHSASGDFHERYLACLLSFERLDRMIEFTNRLSSLIRNGRRCSAALVRLVWRAVLTPTFVLPRSLQRKLLIAVQDRIMRLHATTSRIKEIEAGSMHTRLNILSVADISMAFRTSIFSWDPTLRSALTPLYQWAAAQASRAFRSRLPVAIRWNHLITLALTDFPSSLSGRSMMALAQMCTSLGKDAANWRTICILSALQSISSPASPSVMEPGPAQIVKGILRTLWYKWTTAREHSPTFVTQAIATSFLHFAGRTRDSELKAACSHFCFSSNLWKFVGEHGSSTRQTQELAAAYILASAACDGENWTQIFADISPHFHPSCMPHVASIVLRRLIEQNAVLVAYSFYIFTCQHGLQLPNEATCALASCLVSKGHLELAFQFLSPQFPNALRCQLLGVILQHLTLSGELEVDLHVASVIANVMRELFADVAPPLHLRRFIEFTIPAIASAEQSSAAVSLIKTVHAIDPDYFGMPCLIRLLHVLLERRQFRNVLALYRVVAQYPRAGLANFRRTVLMGLARSQAASQASQASRINVASSIPGNRTLALAHAQSYRKLNPDRFLALRIVRLVSRSVSDPHVIHFALCVLARARRLTAAQRLFQRTHANFSPQWQTSMCNVILHGTLLKRSSKNRQRIMKLLKTMSFYIDRYGFKPDRVSINILLKAIIQWETGPDDVRLHRLFDHVIRTVYTSTVAGQRETAPFDTSPQPTVLLLPLPKLPSDVSFRRHVVPMYKLFIKGLYARGDIRGARKLFGLLREETMAARGSTRAESR